MDLKYLRSRHSQKDKRLLRRTQSVFRGVPKINYNNLKQGVALTGRNTAGAPSCVAPWSVTLHMRRHGVLYMTTDDRRRQTPGSKTTLALLLHV